MNYFFSAYKHWGFIGICAVFTACGGGNETSSPAPAPAVQTFALSFSPAPADNPLKGFLPFQGAYSSFPHSLEFVSMGLSDVQKGDNTFDWTWLEDRLSQIAIRGHHVVLSTFIDYPGQPSALPLFLASIPRITDGTDSVADYNRPQIQKAILDFIKELGTRYNGDPRMASIQLGLLGFWGEWHTFPHEWMPSVAFQNQVIEAYVRAFSLTWLSAREPKLGVNMDRTRLGFNDGSFAFETVGPTAWHFWPRLKSAGFEQLWRTKPISGEVRPEVQDCLFSSVSCAPPGQEFPLAVMSTHPSWLVYHGLFDKGALNSDVHSRAIEAAQSMGYTLHVPMATLSSVQTNRAMRGSVSFENRGVAPFYQPWTVHLGVQDSEGNLREWPMNWDLTTVLPDAPKTWSFDIPEHGMTPGTYTLMINVPNNLANGKALAFANGTQNHDRNGWLSLGVFTVQP